ncbi:MAG: hypothetical protein HY038_10465 [Nitrospirae bacterium]|nr:hypothetical protein [Nitrospirota bacterium]
MPTIKLDQSIQANEWLVRKGMKEARYRLVAEHSFLQDQHFQLFAVNRP